MLNGCAGDPPKPPPALLAQAYALEREGAQRFERGELAGADSRFAEAAQAFRAIDDGASVVRVLRHRAQTALAGGQAEKALRSLNEVITEDSEALALRVQAQLALGDLPNARASLARARLACAAPCRAAGFELLAARLALAQGDARAAIDHATTAQEALRKTAPTEAREVANAARLLAEALLAHGEPLRARQIAEEALRQDRQLALPEKIASDWLLIARIEQKLGAGEAAPSKASEALAHARRIARAAKLPEVLRAADAIDPQGVPR